MEEAARSLFECLREEEGHYSRLVRLAQQQREVLVAGREEALVENVKLQEKEVFALGPLRARREEAVKRLAKGLGLQKPSLEGLLENCPAPWGDELRKAAGRLIQTVRSLDESNRGNGKLLGNAVNLAKFTLRAIQEGGSSQRVGRAEKPEGQKASFVNRVI